MSQRMGVRYFTVAVVLVVVSLMMNTKRSSLTPAKLLASLLGISIFTIVQASRLSLPLPTSVTTLVTVTPILTGMSLWIGRTKRAARYIYPILLALSMFISVLLGIVGPLASDGPVEACRLDDQWLKLFRAKKAKAIKSIEESLECCGLRSVVDRPWPFPGSNTAPTACRDLNGWTQPCLEPWGAIQRGLAKTLLGVLVASWLLHICGMVLFRVLNQGRYTAGRTRAVEEEEVYSDVEHARRAIEAGDGDRDEQEDSSRPLIENLMDENEWNRQ